MRQIRGVNAGLIGFLLVFLLSFYVEARADRRGPDVEVEVETQVNTDVAGDTIGIDGDRAFAVGGSTFDVDINQCLASKATNIIVVGWQVLKENPTCIADGLDARGNHDAAARVRCTYVETIRDTYADHTFKECVLAVTMRAPDRPPPPPPPAVDDDDDDDRYDALQQQLASLVEEKDRSDKATARYEAQQREDEKEDRLYAQQLIEQIQQIEEPPAQMEEPLSDN